MFLTGKTILIISPQNWGKMFLSKHHYAIELAKRGNNVYFLNPPHQAEIRFKNCVRIKESGYKGLSLIEHHLYFPYWLKFKARSVFHFLMKWHLIKILKQINRPLDVVWSFDIGNLIPFYLFQSKTYKIYHPVDEPESMESIRAAQGSNVIISVTNEILDKYVSYKINRYLINHGLSQDFIDVQKNELFSCNDAIQIGLTGNFLRPDIDRETLNLIISENPNVNFNLWGVCKRGSNIGDGEDKKSEEFIDSLEKFENVKFHGQFEARLLSKQIQNMDAFLICYDINLDHSKGTNYHKIMEFLSTGKVIISNNVTAYANKPELVQMVASRTDNEDLPQLFKHVLNDIAFHNSATKRLYRRSYALENSYERQIEKIEKFINQTL